MECFGVNDKSRRLKFGLYNEVIFLKSMNDLLENENSNCKIVKYANKYNEIDFYIYNELNDKIVNLELKTRRFRNNNIKLYANASKFRYIKNNNLENTFLIWKDYFKNNYYYVLINKENIDEILNMEKQRIFNQLVVEFKTDEVRKCDEIKIIYDEIKQLLI